MLPNKSDAYSSFAFGPIDCILIIYKLRIAVIAKKIYVNCEQNIILTEEHKGCCRNSRGCKDLATIGGTAVLQAAEN